MKQRVILHLKHSHYPDIVEHFKPYMLGYYAGQIGEERHKISLHPDSTLVALSCTEDEFDFLYEVLVPGRRVHIKDGYYKAVCSEGVLLEEVFGGWKVRTESGDFEILLDYLELLD